jgi:hypothetical protein
MTDINDEAIKPSPPWLNEVPRQSCLLCGAQEVAIRGMFKLSQKLARRIGAPAGKQRIVVYDLCAACFELGQVAAERVEDKILAEMQVQ